MKTIVLNHKSYLSYDEIIKYKEELSKISKENINIILFPNLAYQSLFKNYNISIGTQNFYSYNFGSYTGETSLEILKSLDVTYTLIGHPERLILKIDDYNQIKDKLFKSLNSNFKTILCLGHSENMKILKKELKFFFKGLDYNVFKNLIIAFEPASKIEDGEINLNEIEFVKDYIKTYMEKHYEIEVPFLYGGSVNKDNIEDILKITDGVILGKISTNIESLTKIINNINKQIDNKEEK